MKAPLASLINNFLHCNSAQPIHGMDQGDSKHNHNHYISRKRIKPLNANSLNYYRNNTTAYMKPLKNSKRGFEQLFISFAYFSTLRFAAMYPM